MSDREAERRERARKWIVAPATAIENEDSEVFSPNDEIDEDAAACRGYCAGHRTASAERDAEIVALRERVAKLGISRVNDAFEMEALTAKLREAQAEVEVLRQQIADILISDGKKLDALTAQLREAQAAIREACVGWMESEAQDDKEDWSKKLYKWLDLPAIKAAMEAGDD